MIFSDLSLFIYKITKSVCCSRSDEVDHLMKLLKGSQSSGPSSTTCPPLLCAAPACGLCVMLAGINITLVGAFAFGTLIPTYNPPPSSSGLFSFWWRWLSSQPAEGQQEASEPHDEKSPRRVEVGADENEDGDFWDGHERAHASGRDANLLLQPDVWIKPEWTCLQDMTETSPADTDTKAPSFQSGIGYVVLHLKATAV